MSKALGIEDFAKAANVKSATARVILRDLKVKKEGKSYSFKSAEEIKNILKKRGSTKPVEKKKPAAKKKATPKKKVASKE